MKAIVKREGAPGLWMEEVERPKPKADEVLIAPHITAICGTDLLIYKWNHWAQKNVPTPLVIGHEFVGEIVELGSDVEGWKVGDLVSGEGHITCGKCKVCTSGKRHLCKETKVIGIHTHGVFAEVFPLPAENLYRLPEGVSKETAAIFDPLGNAVHSLFSFPLKNETLLITGAGPIGVMAVLIAKFAGVKKVVITDINDYRLDLARKAGADAAVNITKQSLQEEMKRLGIDGFTVATEMSGNSQAFTTILEEMEPGGKISLLGILPPSTEIDWDLVIFKMLELKGIFGREIFETWDTMKELLQAGLSVDKVITHRFPAEEFEKGFEKMFSGESGKVLLDWRREKSASLPTEERARIA